MICWGRSFCSPCCFVLSQRCSRTTNFKFELSDFNGSWRRGWDSNPRNGSPFTAFPVLPIQPLLHLSGKSIANFRVAIAHCSARSHANLAKGQSEICIWKSAMPWRRGWDSNPRWALTHSGFRDRCTNPLCDLSVIKEKGKSKKAK
jgi:hypothetical protein